MSNERHHTGRKYTDYERALLRGEIKSPRKLVSVITVYSTPTGARCMHLPRGDIERLRQRQREQKGAARGLYAVLVLPDGEYGLRVGDAFEHVENLRIGYKPNPGVLNFWGAAWTCEEPPEVAEKIIVDLSNELKLESGVSDDNDEDHAKSIKGIF